MFKALKQLPVEIFERVNFKIMQVPQPWHPASCTKHLAARAIAMLFEGKEDTATDTEGKDMSFWNWADMLFNL